MSRFAWSGLAVLFGIGLLLTSSCSLLQSDGTDANSSAKLLETSQSRYEARLLTEEGDTRVVFDVPYRTRNTTADTLYLIGCNTPPPPVLEKRVDGSWQTAYAPVVLLCLSPPWALPPGAVREDTLHVVARLSGEDVAPTFETDVPGTYRLQRQIYSRLTDERPPTGEALVPLERRISNTFVVERAASE
jgi:hypothetical protein